jgi:hypothetical protein
LSVDAVQESVSEVWATALAVRPVGVDGGVVSVGGGGGGDATELEETVLSATS